MMDRQGGRLVFECDNCGEVAECETSDFAAEWGMLRGEGWRAFQYGDDWMHHCPRCERRT